MIHSIMPRVTWEASIERIPKFSSETDTGGDCHIGEYYEKQTTEQALSQCDGSWGHCAMCTDADARFRELKLKEKMANGNYANAKRHIC